MGLGPAHPSVGRKWQDAFRAGGYNAEQTARYVTKIKAKIAQGRALSAD